MDGGESGRMGRYGEEWMKDGETRLAMDESMKVRGNVGREKQEGKEREGT